MIETNRTEPVTFGLVHGAHHDATAWDKLRPVLERMGHKTVAMDLPIDQEGVNLDTYAECIADALSGQTNIVLVGHSRMGRAIARVPRLIPIRHLVYLNANIKAAADQKDIEATLPPVIFPEYEAGRRQVPGTTFVEYDKTKAMIFFSDFDSSDENIEASIEDIQRVIARFRPQNHDDDAPPLDKQPGIPATSIISTADKVVRPDYLRNAALAYLGKKAIEIPGGHSPFLLRPTLLAGILHQLAGK